LGIFASAFGSTDNLNLCGPRKLELIMQRFPEAPFDYAANSHDDVPVLSRARHAVLVNPARGLKRRVSNVSCTFDDRRGFLRSLTRAMRPYQWAKNVLVFVPLFTAHLWLDARALATGLLGFVSLSLAASSVYLLNDLLDIEADRAHPRKKSRPLAAGDMSVVAAGLAVIALSGASITMAAFLSRPFLPILLLYLASTSLYSFFLKRFVLLDVIMLAGLYTLRVIAGAAAVAVEVSFWLLAFSMFVFLSLALVKRCAELQLLAAQDGMAAAGRDYRTTDLGTLRIVGVGCGLLAVLVVALYIHSPDMSGLYTSPHTLWLLCPLILYWICRVWLKTERGEMHDDPIVFAVKDKTSYLVGLCTVLVVVLATFAPPLFFL
jgi:4-hydroxybenzoate polyprenyltransferase